MFRKQELAKKDFFKEHDTLELKKEKLFKLGDASKWDLLPEHQRKIKEL
jgi:hypothetical protein